ncbi:MAG: V-type ATP synthase subunit D [Planctomycetota bacterium]
MNIKVNATRMEMMRLRRRLAIAVRGHKLLKDKLEGLTQQFLVIVKEYRQARDEMRRELPGVMQLFVLARLTSSASAIDQALAQVKTTGGLAVGRRKIMGVSVPTFEWTAAMGAASYSLLDTPAELDHAIAALDELFKKIIRLAELEQTVRVLSVEIERTRRRTNALEYTLIPQIRSTIRTIKGKLEEIERGNITRLMKVKEMIAGK